ncbi:coiled-coil domain-containing protein 27-like [Styela clava]
MSHSIQTSRKGSSIYENMTSRSSSGFGEDNFSLRPDTAPGNPRDQILPISPLAINERSKSAPRNMRMTTRYGSEGHVKLSSREILESGSPVNRQERPKTVEPEVQETLQKEQPWYMAMLREKEERLLQMGDEINRLSAFEIDSKQKDNEIFDLRRQLAQNVVIKTTQETELEAIVADLRKRTQILTDEIVRLGPFEEECKKNDKIISQFQEKIEFLERESQQKSRSSTPSSGAKKPLIYVDETSTTISEPEGSFQKNPQEYDEKVESVRESLRSANADADALREQFDKMAPEKLTPEDEVMAMREELVKREQIISELQDRLETSQKELVMNDGFINALQRDLESTENKVMKLTSQVEKAEFQMNEALAEARTMSKKFSDLRERRKHSDMNAETEHELTILKNAFNEIQQKADKLKEKSDKQSKEIRESHKKIKKGGELDKKQSEEIKHLCRDLEDMRRLEQLSRVSAEQMSTRFERLRSRIIQAVFITPGAAHPSTAISDIVVFNAVKKIIEDRSEFHKLLEETNADFPPLLVELDATLEEEKIEESSATTATSQQERKSGKGGRKSPKHR